MNTKFPKIRLTYHNLRRTIITMQIQRIINSKKKWIYSKANCHQSFSGSMSTTLSLSLMGTDPNLFLWCLVLFLFLRSNAIQDILQNLKKPLSLKKKTKKFKISMLFISCSIPSVKFKKSLSSITSAFWHTKIQPLSHTKAVNS